jgi:hypothetical protein
MNADEIRRMNTLVKIIERHGDFAYGNNTPEDVAIEWDDWDILPEEVDSWLSSGNISQSSHSIATSSGMIGIYCLKTAMNRLLQAIYPNHPTQLQRLLG